MSLCSSLFNTGVPYYFAVRGGFTLKANSPKQVNHTFCLYSWLL